MPPAAAIAIPAGISAGTAIGSAIHSHKQEKKADAQQKTLMDAQMARQKQMDAFGQPLATQGGQNMGIAQNYLRNLASGDRGLTMQTLAPEINALMSGTQGAVAAQRGLFPRGGMSASRAAEIPLQAQGQINNAMFAARPQAINALGALGGNQTSLGLGAMGQAGGLTNSMLQLGLQSRQQQFEQGQGLGQGIGGFLQFANQLYNQYGGSNNSLSPLTMSQNLSRGIQPRFGDPFGAAGQAGSLYGGGVNTGSLYSKPSKPYSYGGEGTD